MMSPTRDAAEWTQARERGSLPVIRFMVGLSIAIGRTASRVVVRAVALYFLATSGSARRHTAAYLARLLGRPPSFAEQYALFFAFASTIHDRIYFLRGQFELFDIDVKGAELFDSQGALLMGGHLGSFEVLRACGRQLGKRRVAMAMFEESPGLRRVLAAVNPDVAQDIIALGRPQSMLELAARLEEGALVGMLADRTLGAEPAVQVPFLGDDAPFPTGPMRIAAALRRRVIFMAGLYMGGNRYEIRFEPLADFTQLDTMNREARDAAVREAVHEYARRLEQATRHAPDNWFNFHDFWSKGT
jgi:predicted LPLAT superfamily acyltransferase